MITLTIKTMLNLASLFHCTLSECMAKRRHARQAWKHTSIALVIAILTMSPRANAIFDDTGTGARPTALGGAYVSMGDDTQSLMYNPAGLARMERKEFTSEYSRLYMGLTDGSNISQFFLGYGQRISYGGTLAFGWKQLTLDSLYAERTLSLGYGEWLTDRIAIGGALKQLYHSFGVPTTIVDNSGNVQAGQPTFFSQNGNSNTAYSSDLGFLFKATDRHTVGLAVQDMNEPNVALSNEYRRIVPRTLRAGLSYRVQEGFQISGALTTRENLDNQNDKTWTGAFERWWKFQNDSAVAVRGSLSAGSREFRQFAFGPSYRVGGFQADYSVIMNLAGISVGDTVGTHRFSLSYQFGAPPVKALERKKAPKPKAPKLIDTTPPTLGPWLEEISEPERILMQEEGKPYEKQTPEASTGTVVAPAPVVESAPRTDGLQGSQPVKPIAPQPRTKKATIINGVPTTYVVQEGDTLVSIAKKFYGDPDVWRVIYTMNSDRLGVGGGLTPGKVLVLPVKQ